MTNIEKNALAEDFDPFGADAYAVDAGTEKALSRLRVVHYFAMHGIPIVFSMIAVLIVGSRFLLTGILSCWPETVTYPFCVAHLVFLAPGSPSAIAKVLLAGVLAAAIHGTIGAGLGACILLIFRCIRQKKHNITPEAIRR